MGHVVLAADQDTPDGDEPSAGPSAPAPPPAPPPAPDDGGTPGGDASRRAAANAMLRAAARLAAVADGLDALRGRALDQEQRDRRDDLLREQWAARRRYEEAFARFSAP